jgi:hypothetical protein
MGKKIIVVCEGKTPRALKALYQYGEYGVEEKDGE